MTTTSIRAATIAIGACALLAPLEAFADSACLPDAQRFCAGIPIGDGRVLTCLKARWKDLSSACQQDIQRVENRARQISNACAADVWQYCANVRPGQGRIRTCLWARWNDLSSTCREEAARVAEKSQQLWEKCSADAAALCPGMQPGGGLIYLCLKAQESKASSACRQEMSTSSRRSSTTGTTNGPGRSFARSGRPLQPVRAC